MRLRCSRQLQAFTAAILLRLVIYTPTSVVERCKALRTYSSTVELRVHFAMMSYHV